MFNIKRLQFDSERDFWERNLKSNKSLKDKGNKGNIESSTFLYDSYFKTNDSEGKVLACKEGDKVDVYIMWN